ncbi:MAG: Capsular glucan synthase [Candidatus Izimaplasma bacterium HR2]|nr:MAG: Capsular glucan synthase [Candidatus Izimaplasma bacterium HR2]
MIKVIYDNIIYSIQRYGGISVYWKELTCRIQQNKNVDLQIIEYKNSKSNMFRKNLKINKEFLVNKKCFISPYFERYLNLKSSGKKLTIFHSSYYRSMKGKNNLNIVTVHDFTYEKTIKTFIAKIHIYQKRKSLEKAAGIICISENTRADLLNLYPKLNNREIKVIHNGFNKDDYFPIQELHMLDYVIFVGSRSGYKNFINAVEVTSNLNNIELVIVGAPLTNNEKQLLNTKLQNRYKSYEYISNEKLNVLYNSAICLLYLSEYEGFGIPVLEAMSSGCPVIALRKSSIPEVAGSAGILFDNLNTSLIAIEVNKLKDDYNYRDIQIKAGLLNSEKFSWDKCYKEVLSFYKYILLKNKNNII